MSEQQSGLRFDIYERVHLDDQARGIQELDEVELVPHIQVVSQSDLAVLKGYLQLSGSYLSEGDEGRRALEHQIPVEITLPLSRVGNAQDLFVEIENFDIDLLSPRSLNVTGVLSLHGVEIASAAQEPEWRAEEEFVFVHRPEERAAEEPQPTIIEEEPDDRHLPASQVFIAEVEPQAQDVEQDAPAAAQPSDETPEQQSVEANANEANANEFAEAVEVFAPEVPAVEEAELQPEVEIHAEKKDVKVAFGSKKVAEMAQEAAVGIKSLLQKSTSIFQERRRAAAEAETAQAAAEPPRSEGVEWKKLFLSPAADGQEFRKLKMAIVQKEETLETIAQRYQINPRELLLLNRLQDSNVSEGQVIYIPR
ncbi:LysM peptidoglycan-binding domain-containing protein [Paenibacillus chartarius]|uniref:LysM peptidoglycan-binding domain-containing protein n=1 Tax=Paenibacillus chartarius TaxID=747481 RepID=A0ABV6DJ08_9BACL